MNLIMDVSGQDMAAQQAMNSTSTLAWTSFSIGPLLAMIILSLVIVFLITFILSDSLRKKIEKIFSFIRTTLTYFIIGFMTCSIIGVCLTSIYGLFKKVGTATIDWMQVLIVLLWVIIALEAFAVIGYGTKKYIITPLGIDKLLK